MPGSVLIIDADEEFAGRLKSTLEGHGAEVQVTGDGRAGLDMARAQTPSAIVVCVELPRMSGYSICAKLKKDPTLKAVTLVITSAEATQETFEHHKKLKNRAEEYLRKPFEARVLVDVLQPYMQLEPTDDVVASHDISIVPDPPVIDDADAFSDDRFHFDDVPESVERSVVVEAPLDPDDSFDDPFEEDDAEAMTTVGVVPAPGNEILFKEIEQLRTELEAEREAHAETVRDRDEAIANERAAVNQLQTLSTASTSSIAASRDILAAKKELHDRDKQILELRESVQQKERELLTQRDREMEFEGKLVQLQEEMEQAHRDRADLENQVKGLKEEVARGEGAQADLRADVARLTEELEQSKRTIAGNNDEIESLRSTNQTLNTEVTRATNEASAVAAEASTLRDELHAAQAQQQKLDIDLQDVRLKADSARNALEATQASLVETEEQAARAFERIRRDGETKTKVRQALDIALRLLTEPEEENGVEETVTTIDEVRPA